MKKIMDFLRKIGVLHVSKGDYETGGFDDRSDLKKSDDNPQRDKIEMPQEKKKFVLWGAIALAVLFLLAALGAGGGFLMMFIIWAVTLYIVKSWAMNGKVTLVIVIVTLIVALIFSLIAMPSSDPGTVGVQDRKAATNLPTTIKCEAASLATKADDRITVSIVDKKNTQKDMTQDVYTIDELDHLQYGYNAQETADGYYVMSELCQGDKTLSFDDLEAKEWNYKLGAGNGSSGHYSSFASEQSDGRMSRDIEEPGEYTVYAYISHDGKKWFVAQKLTFEVQ